MSHRPDRSFVLPFLSGLLIVLTAVWGVILARQENAKKLTKEKLDALATAASKKTGVKKELILAVIQVESAGRPKAKSPAGAKGLMQLMPGTAKDMLKKAGYKRNTDWVQPEVNVRLGSEYLKMMHKMFGNDLDKSLAAYNAGPGNVKKWVRRAKAKGKPDKWLSYGFKETRNYVPKVKEYYKKFSKPEK